MTHWAKQQNVRRAAGKALRIALIYLFLLTLAPAALAQDASPASPAAPNADDGALEVGVWYVNDYENCGGWGLGDLGTTDDDALSLRSRLSANPFWFFIGNPTPPWSAPLTWGNTLAWQKDWTRGAVGGWDDSQADAVDFAYFSGHGASSGWFFGVGGNNKNGCQVTKNDTFQAMGTNDAEWYGISACNVLDDPFANLQGWANSMNGLRLMMGMKTVMSDVNFGNYVGWYLRWGYNFTQAWFWSADALLPGDQVARILAEENAYFYDTWAQFQAPAFVDNDFYWWTHQAGTSLSAASPSALTSNLGQLGGEMPIYNIVPLTTDEANSNYTALTNAFGITTSAPITAVSAADVFGPLGGSSGIFFAPDGSALMDAAGGNYLVINGDNLMNTDTAQAASGQAMRAVTPEEALVAAEQFINDNNLALEGASAGTVVADVVTSAQDSARHTVNAANAGSTLEIVGENPENYKVNFSRQLEFVPFDSTVSSGVNGAVVFDVVGPGPKLSVYVDATSPATATAASIAGEGILGGQGGWRAVQSPQVLAASGQQVMVSMLPTTTIETLFDQLEEQASLDSIPLAAETKEILNITAGYYEGPIGMNMDQLIPVYVLTVKGTLGDGSEQTYNVFIPVNPSYMPPLARIDSPTTGSAISGNTVQLVAADAKKTLAELGYDASLNFVMGTANDDPDAVYNYDWYINEVSGANHIGTGMTLDYEVPAGLASQAGKPFTAKFILVVTDVEKAGDPKTATDRVTLTVNPIYLPTVIK